MVGLFPAWRYSGVALLAGLHQHSRPRIRSRGVLTFNIGFSEEKHDRKEKQWALIDVVVDSARRLPGANAASAVYLRPFAAGAIGMGHQQHHQEAAARRRELEPQPDSQLGSRHRTISVRWTVDCCRARLFTARDPATSPPVVIIGQSLAARLWRGQDPIGMLSYGAPEDGKQPGWQTVVGVVENARYREVSKSG